MSTPALAGCNAVRHHPGLVPATPSLASRLRRRQDDQNWPSSYDPAPHSFAYHARLKKPLRLPWTAPSNITAPAKSP